ncbi:MAG: Crossover junction endodeoxyribonuclease RuvC [Candidatus Uhrbacteria bacterium GW2011_GWA2_53_10]|uniref:Crossover junction endodeoxyribonuclease RuvC n=1 Tax=Candidatus Uhrbacteria bacterium GW2011_GWA2_53_10 TaxID=1618980 RepID=A0A0G1XNU8_9BACT|nr:MAG: Crossover junction endodeoxyribonuclease RuvC [Candidatus Uhrbacteria bacterium GW2011_GWA2_53_10]HBF67412.1 crossover junction endodeoxyribonuclease RuvC [Candidatus Magasanikbacteria bacterium]
MKILGIDPGFGRTGWGVVELVRREPTFVACGCITTPSTMKFPERLIELHRQLGVVIKKYQPQSAAVEKLFFFKNAKTAMDVGQARGVILLTLHQAGLSVHEMTPLQVKQTVTGYGRADKDQIGKMVKLLLGLKTVPKPDDVADALAVALTAGRVV